MLGRLDRLLHDLIARPRGFALALVAVLIASGAILFTRLGAGAIEHTTEVRCYLVIDQMVASGDYLVPMKEGKPRLEKPPLYYWLGAAAAAVDGGVNETSVRAPAAIAAFLMLLLTALWARSIGGPALGLGAALALAGMIAFYGMGRRGVAETTLGVTTLGALFLFERMHFARRPGLLPAFAGAVFLAFLAKATAGLFVIGVPIAVWLLWSRQWKKALSGRVALWLLLAVGAGLSWYVVILTTVPGAFDTFWSELVLPVGVVTEDASALHYYAPWYYVDHLPRQALPAFLLFPIAAWWLWHTRFYAGDPRRRFIALAFVALFIGFSLLPKKQKHYMVPLLPLLAILIADGTISLWRERRALFDRLLRPLGIAVALCALLTTAYLGIYFGPVRGFGAPATAAAVLGMLVLTASLVVAGWRRAPFAMLFLSFLLMVAACIANFAYVMPWAQRVTIAADEERVLPDEQRLLRIHAETPVLLTVFGVRDEVGDRAAQLAKAGK